LTGAELPESRHFTLHELSLGTYAAVASDGGWAICNSGIVDLGDLTVVFDTFVNQDAAAELRQAAVRLTGQPPSVVVNSHWHSDHVKGNQAFKGSMIVSTGKTREMMAKMKDRWMDKEKMTKEIESDPSFEALPIDPDRVRKQGYREGHLAGLPTLDYTLPEVTFGDRLVLHGRRRSAELLTYGGGHTVSDAFLYLPEQGVVFLGDLLFVDSHPYLGDGDPENLLRILDRLEQLDAISLVPGHGPVGTPKDLEPLRDYVHSLERSVEAIRAAGGTLSHTLQVPIPSRFRGWKWRGFYAENLDFLFQRAEKRGQG
jgi:glyoxylase-like metal-dependent hydrolase (beta-lactamase superfamily II)